MGLAALLLAILSLPGCMLNVWLAPVAIVLGALALLLAVLDPQHHAGKLTATLGILIAVGALIVFFVLAQWLHESEAPWGTDVRADCSESLRRLSKDLRDYARGHGDDYPADLGLLPSDASNQSDCLRAAAAKTKNAVTDWDYIAGLDRKAPGTWIIAYGDPKWFNHEGGPILLVNGTVKLLDRPEFDAELQRFIDDYKRVRGSPPTILAAH
jgi:hypothetical protein